jgi:hypothetical protein
VHYPGVFRADRSFQLPGRFRIALEREIHVHRHMPHVADGGRRFSGTGGRIEGTRDGVCRIGKMNGGMVDGMHRFDAQNAGDQMVGRVYGGRGRIPRFPLVPEAPDLKRGRLEVRGMSG